MRKILSAIIFLFFNLGFVYAFSEQDIISPVPGTWNNAQPLVLNIEDGTEIYYSLTGTDPLRFGFAYDAPIVLDQTGNVSLRITAVKDGVERKDYTINYTVKEATAAGTEKTVSFIQDIVKHPLKRYVSGSVFSIPDSFNYYIDGREDRKFKGTDLHLSEKNNVERFVPFTVTDGAVYLHFVLHIIPSQNSLLHSKNLPFSIENWNIISFLSAKYVYAIDDGDWTTDLSAFVLDRLITHVLRWKENSGKEDAEIFSYVLPPMPQMVSSVEPYGQVTFSLMPAPNDIGNETNYKMGKIPQSLSLIRIADGLYDSITIDAFNGEELDSSFYAGVYYDGVYQGVLQHQVIVDRLSPLPPVLSTYKNAHTVLKADVEEGASVFYSISEPIEFDAEQIVNMESRFSDARTGEFKEFSKGKVVLSSISKNSTFYKIQAYSLDRAGNKSDISELRVIVDEYNLYLNPLASESLQRDGSYENPFVTLEESIIAMNELPSRRLHILGNVTVNSSVSIMSDCEIFGRGCNITFAENASLSVDNASVLINNCSIFKNISENADKNLITVTDGSITFDSCQISAVFVSDGILVEASGSSVKFGNTSLAVHASSYACNVKSINSSVMAIDLRAVAVAHTCVNVSLSDSFCTMQRSVTDIVAHIGRSFECIKSYLELEQNTFRAALDAKLRMKEIEAVWKDADTVDNSTDNTILYGL